MKTEGFASLTGRHISEPVRQFAGFSLLGDNVTEKMMQEMLRDIHPDLSNYLKTAVNEALLNAYMNRIIYWVTFSLLEALGFSIVDLLKKVSTVK